jgi:carboxyl-terminal processing protease
MIESNSRRGTRSRLFVAALLAFGAGFACSSDGQDPVAEARELKVYRSGAYGYVVTFDAEAEEAVGYAVVEGICWEQPVPEEVWWASTRDDSFMDFDYLGQKQPGMPFHRVESFAEACPEGSLKTALDDDYVPDFELEYELFQRTFAEHYAFFELREVNWEAQVAAAEVTLSTEMEIEAFFGALRQSVAPLGDGHIFIQAGEDLAFNANRRLDIVSKLAEEALSQDGAPTADVEEYVAGYVAGEFAALDAALSSYFVPESVHGTLEDPIAWGTIEDGGARNGYLRISSFSDIAEGSVSDNVAALHDAVDAAFGDWGDIDGVIVDVRVNHGGWDVLGRALASHFVNEETHVYSKRVRVGGVWGDALPISVTPAEGARYTGPVVVLTSSTTISAAETFAMAMGRFDHVTIVGEPTAGILSDSLPKFLPSGIYFSLSNEEYSTPDDEVFELVGVPPEVAVDVFSLSDRDAGVDGSIVAALTVLRGK